MRAARRLMRLLGRGSRSWVSRGMAVRANGRRMILRWLRWRRLVVRTTRRLMRLLRRGRRSRMSRRLMMRATGRVMGLWGLRRRCMMRATGSLVLLFRRRAILRWRGGRVFRRVHSRAGCVGRGVLASCMMDRRMRTSCVDRRMHTDAGCVGRRMLARDARVMRRVDTRASRMTWRVYTCATRRVVCCRRSSRLHRSFGGLMVCRVTGSRVSLVMFGGGSRLHWICRRLPVFMFLRRGSMMHRGYR